MIPAGVVKWIVQFHTSTSDASRLTCSIVLRIYSKAFMFEEIALCYMSGSNPSVKIPRYNQFFVGMHFQKLS